MIKFNKPQNLNGAELIDELKAVGVIVNAETSPFIDGNGDFWLDIATADKAKAEPIVAAHIAIDQTQSRAQAKAAAQAKLTALGLTVSDLEALGL